MLELLEAEITGRRVREVGEAARFGLDGVEVLLGVATLGVDGGDAILGVADPPARDRGLAGGAVAMSEPGVTGIVVGLPHRWTQHGAQLVFDGGDTFGVRLPRSLSGPDRRLQIGQLGGGLDAPVRSLGESDGEILAALVELVPVADKPRRHDLVRLPGRFRMIGLVGEVASLGDGGDIGSVVGEHRLRGRRGLQRGRRSR